MRLTRRDALAALGAAGTLGAAATLAGRHPPRADDGDGTRRVPLDDGPRSAPLDDDAVETLVAAAAVLYPSSVSSTGKFVRTYVAGRTRRRPAYREGVADAAAGLDATARDWYGDGFPDLPAATRDRLLRELGADTADPDPVGTISGRVRYFVVDELLFALYASPTGGRLVGLENPPGYPGGTASYQRARVPGTESETDSGSGATDAEGDQ
jgi:hypothetical protein